MATAMSGVKRILNATKSTTACEHAVVADRPLARMRGLLGRRELPAGEGLLLKPAPAIHTAFMRFQIDALFLDADLRVLRIVERLDPWRAAGKRHARMVLELSAGEAAHAGIQVGDQLQLVGLPMATTDTPVNGEPDGDAPMRVMVLSTDRRFREVAALLLTRRGCEVSVGDGTRALTDSPDRDRVQVVVIDAGRSLAAAARMVAAVEAFSRPIGIVVVNDQPQPSLRKLRTVPKWGSFNELFAAVERAYDKRTHRRGLLEKPANEATS
jgi:uncharacterized protein